MASSKLIRKAGNEWDLVRSAGGGLNQLAGSYETPEGECADLVNVVFAPDAWVKRKGCVRKLDILTEADIKSMFVTSFTSGTNYLVVCAGTSIYKVDFSADVWVAEELTVDVALTSGQRFDFAMLGNVLYLVNGRDAGLKWRGGSNNVERIGISAPNTGSGAFVSSGNCTAGDHKVLITWYNSNSGTESNYKDFGTLPSGGSDKLVLTGVTASSDAQVTHLRIWMTETGGEIYYLAASVAIGGTYEASIADANLILQQTLPAAVEDGYAAASPVARYIATGKKRLFMGYTYRSGAWRADEIAWSEIVGQNVAVPEYFYALNYRKVPCAGGEITRLVMWGDYLYIFHTRGIAVMTDPANPDQSLITELIQAPGCSAPWSVGVGKFKRPVPAPPELHTEEFELVDGMIYKSWDGVYGFDGSMAHPLSEKVRPSIDEITATAQSECVGFFNDGKYYLSYGNKMGAAGDERELTEYTTDTGGESVSADIGFSGAPAKVYAINYLVNSSKADRSITALVHVDLNYMWTVYALEREISCTFKVYDSIDNGVTWALKATRTVNNTGHLTGDAQTDFLISWVNSGVNAVRVEVVSIFDRLDGLVSDIQLMWVKYCYDPAATVVNNRMLYYDSMTNQWSRFTGWRANCFAAVQLLNKEQVEVFGQSDDGRIYRFNVGWEDDKEPIFCRIVTGYSAGKFEEVQKRWLNSKLQVDIGEGVFNYLVYVDRLEKMNRQIKRSESAEMISYYNEREYGEDYFGSNEGVKNVRVNFEACSGYRIAEEFWSNTRDKWMVRYRIIGFVKRER
jgi:hypothetical protein